MSLSAATRRKLVTALASVKAGSEVADAINAATTANTALTQNNTWTGVNNFNGTVRQNGTVTMSGNVTRSGNLTSTGNETHNGTITINGNVTINGNETHSAGTYIAFNRLTANQGTAIVAGNFTLSSGFGSTANVTVGANSTDSAFSITINSFGSGQGANPTCTLTFRDGAFPRSPVTAIVCRAGGNQQTVAMIVNSISNTSLNMTFNGTPVANETYKVNGIVIG